MRPGSSVSARKASPTPETLSALTSVRLKDTLDPAVPLRRQKGHHLDLVQLPFWGWPSQPHVQQPSPLLRLESSSPVPRVLVFISSPLSLTLRGGLALKGGLSPLNCSPNSGVLRAGTLSMWGGDRETQGGLS